MSSKNMRRGDRSRDAPKKRSGQQTGICLPNLWLALCEDGYKPLTACPEVQMCVGIYADLIGSMTIHLMQNTDKGDMRVKNELSRKLDISPYHLMTRQTFLSMLVYTMMTQGNAIVYPKYTANGLLDDLVPLKPSGVQLMRDGEDYMVMYGGKAMRSDEIVHFVLRPNPERPWDGMGFRVSLNDVVRSLRQTNETKRAIMESPAPSVIVKVDGLSEEFRSKAGRDKLTEQYIETSQAGRPWMIPAEGFSVEQVRPLTLTDLAIRENLELDKRTVAAIFGVPPFLVGIGEFKADEYNWFVTARIMPVANAIAQELTKKLLWSPDLYWKFNERSLMNYSIKEKVEAGAKMVDRMALRRNEWRDWLNLPPDEDMDELLALENYIPAARLGDQKKLEGGEDDG